MDMVNRHHPSPTYETGCQLLITEQTVLLLGRPGRIRTLVQRFGSSIAALAPTQDVCSWASTLAGALFAPPLSPLPLLRGDCWRQPRAAVSGLRLAKPEYLVSGCSTQDPGRQACRINDALDREVPWSISEVVEEVM